MALSPDHNVDDLLQVLREVTSRLTPTDEIVYHFAGATQGMHPARLFSFPERQTEQELFDESRGFVSVLFKHTGPDVMDNANCRLLEARINTKPNLSAHDFVHAALLELTTPDSKYFFHTLSRSEPIATVVAPVFTFYGVRKNGNIVCQPSFSSDALGELFDDLRIRDEDGADWPVWVRTRAIDAVELAFRGKLLNKEETEVDSLKMLDIKISEAGCDPYLTVQTTEGPLLLLPAQNDIGDLKFNSRPLLEA
jgi:hypothetical protein